MIAIIIWYAWMQVFALGGWLVTSSWLRRLPDRGYGISKITGVIIGGFTYWWSVTLGFAHNDSGAVILAITSVIALGLVLLYVRSHTNTEYAASLVALPSGRVIVCTELVFALSFFAAAIYRAYNPEIMEAGGEKFMEYMLLNSILRSSTFPPNDAWLAGYPVSYYYFGYIIMAMITRISGIAHGIAFNLSGAMFFALTLTSAFSVGYNLTSAERDDEIADVQPLPTRKRITMSSFTSPRALLAGLSTAIMLGVMGNLGGFMESVRCANVLPASYWSWLDIRDLDQKPVECEGLRPTRYYWWWDWSRVVHDYSPAGGNQEVITETPAFSAILGDNHPHVMSLALVLLAVTLALHYYRAGFPTHQTTDRAATVKQKIALLAHSLLIMLRHNVLELLLLGVVLGGLSFMNTWDLPVYGALLVGAGAFRCWKQRTSLLPLIFPIAALIVGYALYLPFYATFASQARGIGVNLLNGTRFVQFFMMFAPLLTLVVPFIVIMVLQSRIPLRRIASAALTLVLASAVLIVAGMTMLGLISPQVREWFSELNSTGNVMGVSRAVIMGMLLQRLADPWTSLILLTLISVTLTLLYFRSRDMPDGGIPRPHFSADNFVIIMILLGALLTVAVEFVFLRDLFGTRMNTVFKFYYQAWTLWAVASGYAIIRLASVRHWLPRLTLFAASLAVLAGLLYPVWAVLTKANDFTGSPNLDGTAYLQRNKADDAKMIAWLNANVDGAPTIVEAPSTRYGAYQYNGRISAFTGLPAVLGWAGHQHQWRGNYDEPARREPLIEELFNTTDTQVASQILSQFKIQYVIVGETERGRYNMEGLDKFQRMCTSVYRAGTSTIYQCEP